MKRKLFLLIILPALTLMNCSRSDSKKTTGNASGKKNITLKGSDTVLPVGQKEAESYMKKNPVAAISVTGGGSGVGITALLAGTTDIAMSSRDLKTEEKLKFNEKEKEIVRVVVAFDALSVIVNPENKVSQLTREQLELIYTGKITNWKEVGGEDGRIVAYARESSSGTFEFFKEAVMEKKNYAPSVLSMPATGAIVQSVSQTKGAIGYVGIAYGSPAIKCLSISYDNGKTYVAPSINAAKDKSYPISRPLFFFFDKKNTDKIQAFTDYVISEEGQKQVTEIGYVPAN